MTQVNVIGSILDSSGYSIHTRELIKSLSKLTEVKLTSQIQPGQEALLSDKEIEMLKRKDKKEINLVITNPLFWRTYLTAKRNWVYLIWEGDKISRHYLDECMNEDIEYIIVPSEHTKDAILKTIVNDMSEDTVINKIKVIHHGVDLDLFYSKDKPTDVFRFMVNKGWRNNEDRGGTQYCIQAFLEEFTSKDNVELLLKINPAYGIPNVQQLIEELKPKDKTDFPKIVINQDNIQYDKLVDLYNQANVFVMSTRAESFGIPGAESSECNLMQLATGYGGQCDYIKDGENGLLIDYKLGEVQHEILYENCKWAIPDINDLRKKMRWCYENQDEVKEMGKKAGEMIKDYTWDKTAQRIVSLIK